MTNIERESLEQALRELANKNGGRFTAEDVVNEARDNPNSPFARHFEWDVEKAAWQHWLDKARELIRSIRVEVKVEDKTFRIVEYVRDPNAESHVQGYVAVQKLRMDKDQAKLAIMNEFSRADAYLERAKGLAAYLEGVEKPTERAQRAVRKAKESVGQ